MEQPVLYNVENQTALITLNRPERRNAINRALLAMLCDSIERASADDGVKAAVLTGNGASFCSGLDLACLKTDDLLDPGKDIRRLPNVFEAREKPIIGAINGHAITGGFELALNCDFLIASENASFADTHAKVGIHPGWGMTVLLRRAVGQGMAKQMSLTGRFLSAEEALRVGLVNEVTPPDLLIPRAMEIASQTVDGNYEMMLTIKKRIERAGDATLREALEEEREGYFQFVKKLAKP
ncbi:MAG: enoyl-CoA hydratase [Desulfobacterales bacterium]|nr:enoyl-CoA hydratase [Desulfobacterales bacterium]